MMRSRIAGLALALLSAAACQGGEETALKADSPGLVLQCTVTVSFAAGSSTLSGRAESDLDVFIKSCGPGLAENTAALVIESHAGVAGPVQHGLSLSQQRIDAVRHYLFAAQLNPRRVQLASRGDAGQVSVFVRWD